MEAVEDVAAAAPPLNKHLSSPIAIKGKRTKRQRPHSPISFTITHYSPTFSGDGAAASEESTTTAEADTARCLLLLSRGHFENNPSSNDHHYNPKLQISNKTYNNSKICGYACKTCNRVFPSFQALGGHRASHKKPKNEKKIAIFSDEEDFPSPSISSSKNRFLSNSLSLQLSNISTTTFSATPKSSPSPRIHECSYCGAEFTSGQALGGHMRKHRGGLNNRTTPFIVPEASINELEIEQSKMKTRNIGLSLDLNLPAPEDQENNQKLGNFTPEEKDEEATTTGHVISTTAPPLVDCRY